jgi:hypothetical protein
MFTQAMPAFMDALRPAVPPSSIGPLAQALGNCGQPLSHRGGVNFVAPRRRNQNGTFGGGSWNPETYQNLYPGGATHNSANYHNQVDLGDMSNVYNEGNRYDSQFFFPTNQTFQQTQFFGGPTVHVSGGQYIDYITNEYFDGDTVNVTNTTTETFNGDPVAGPQGAPGQAGKDGQRGAPGAPGQVFAAIPRGQFGPIRYLTGQPKIQWTDERVARKHRYIKDADTRTAVMISIPTDAISGALVTVTPAGTGFLLPTDAINGGTFLLSPEPVSITVPLTMSFDPDTCTVSVDSTTTFYAFPSLPGEQSLVTTPASSETLTVASTSLVTATVSTTAASTTFVLAASTDPPGRASVVTSKGFVLKDVDADFWERNPQSVVVASKPRLVDINPQVARVFLE